MHLPLGSPQARGCHGETVAPAGPSLHRHSMSHKLRTGSGPARQHKTNETLSVVLGCEKGSMY